MKNFLLSCLAAAITLEAVIFFSGCSTSAVTTAYKAESASDTFIATAWNLWTNAVVTLQIPTNHQVPVVAAFNKTRAAEIVVIDATAALAATTNSATTGAALQAVYTQSLAAFTQDLQDIGTLLGQFHIKLP